MKRWYLWVGLLISVLFLFFALRGLHITDVWEGIKSADYIWVIPAVFIYFLAVWMRAFRWHLFLHPIKTIPIKRLFPVVTIGYMGNNIFPARAGEVLRSVVLKRQHKVSVSASLATIVIERVFDGVVMLGFIILNLSQIASMPGTEEFTKTIHAVSLWGSLIFFSILLLFLLAGIFPEKANSFLFLMIGKLIPIKWRGKIQLISQKFINGLRTLSSPTEVFKIIIMSIAIWLLETGFYWFIMLAFPFRVNFLSLMLLNGFINLFTIIPSSPGYIGTFDAPGIAVLNAFGVNPEISASYTLLLHASLWLPVTIVGGLFFSKAGLDWRREIDRADKEG